MKRNRERREPYLNTESHYKFAKQLSGLTHRDREALIHDYATKLLIALRVDQEQKSESIKLLETWQLNDARKLSNKIKSESRFELRLDESFRLFRGVD